MAYQSERVPVNIVGSSTFGRYPKISDEKTYNMFTSDKWLINYAGFSKFIQVQDFGGEGRGLFHSIRGDLIIAVISSSVYRISNAFGIEFIGNIDTNTGLVVMAENLSRQIAIADGQDLYIYNYENNTLTKQSLTFASNPIIPNYVSHQNGFFLIASNPNSFEPQNWYAATRDTDNTITIASTDQFEISTKGDNAIAVLPIPGKGNNVIVFGSSVAEVWTQVGGLENYRRVQSFNIDLGCVSVSTIATSEDLVCWLSQNEANAPTIVVSDGGSKRKISTDGIDFLMQSLKRPDKSTAFFYKQDGHLFYQITFFDPADNLTLFYDFNTDKFYHASDEKLDYHPARKIVFFQGQTYFVSLNDANLYEMNTNKVTYKFSDDPDDKGETIPRIRICKSTRKKSNEPFRASEFSFWMEQGYNDNFLIDPDNQLACDGFIISQGGEDFIVTQSGEKIITQDAICAEAKERPRVDMSISKNGNASFSNVVGQDLNIMGRYANRVTFHRLGRANELTVQLRFWGMQRFVCNDGWLEITV